MWWWAGAIFGVVAFWKKSCITIIIMPTQQVSALANQRQRKKRMKVVSAFCRNELPVFVRRGLDRLLYQPTRTFPDLMQDTHE